MHLKPLEVAKDNVNEDNETPKNEQNSENKNSMQDSL